MTTQNNTTIVTPDTLIFSFNKTSCRGICPVYSLDIYNSGKANYKGVKNVVKIGNYSKTFSKSKIDSLKANFIKEDFFQFDDEYYSKVMDLPTTYISFTYNSKTKKIKDYFGAPAKLKALEKLLEDLSETSNWIKKE